MRAQRSAICASLMRWIYDFNSTLPSPLPWCSGKTAREWMAIVDPWSWWPRGSVSLGSGIVDFFLSLQSSGIPMHASVTTGEGVRVAITCAKRVAAGRSSSEVPRGRDMTPNVSSGHFVRR